MEHHPELTPVNTQPHITRGDPPTQESATLGRLERQDQPRCRVITLARLANVLDADPASIAVLVRLGKNDPPRRPRTGHPDR